MLQASRKGCWAVIWLATNQENDKDLGKQEEQLSAARRGKHSNYMFSLRKHFNALSIHMYKEYLNVFLPNSFPCRISVEKKWPTVFWL